MPSGRRLAAPLALLTLLTASGNAARADVIPTMSVSITGANTTSWTVCGTATADVTIQGTFVLTVTGFRTVVSSVFDQVIAEPRIGFGQLFYECVWVPKWSAPDGVGAVAFTFIGTGNDYFGAAGGYFKWGFGQPDDYATTGIS